MMSHAEESHNCVVRESIDHALMSVKMFIFFLTTDKDDDKNWSHHAQETQQIDVRQQLQCAFSVLGRRFEARRAQ